MSANAAEHAPDPSRLGKLLGPYRALQGNRNLGLLFGGQVVSAMGDWLYVATVVVLVFTLTGSAVLAACLSFARLLPYIIILPVSGILADRFDRRALMITADLGRAVCMLGLLLAATRDTIWPAFPLVFIATCLGSLFRPALGATVPTVAGDREQLVQANALMSQIDAMALVLGPALAGVLILLGDARAAFAINAVTYGVSAGTLALLRLPERLYSQQPADGGWLGEVLVGARFLFRARGGTLGAVTLSTAGMTAFNGGSWTLFVALAAQTWHFGSQGSGFLLAVYGVGGMLGGFCVGAITRRFRPTIAYAGSLAAGGIAIILFGLSPAGVLPFALLAGFGLTDVVNQVVGNTLIQNATPDALLGRVFGAFEAIVVGTTVLGALATAPLLTTIGPRGATIVLALIALATLVATFPRLRALEDETSAPDPVPGLAAAAS